MQCCIITSNLASEYNDLFLYSRCFLIGLFFCNNNKQNYYNFIV